MALGEIVAGVIGGVAANIATKHVEKSVTPAIDSLAGSDPTKTTDDYLNDIHLTLVQLIEFFKLQQSGHPDIYKFIKIYKQGQGPPYKPSHIGNRQHFVILSGGAILLNCAGSALGYFNVTTNAGDWTVLDFPENCEYLLDATVTAPNGYLVFWQRETNALIARKN